MQQPYPEKIKVGKRSWIRNLTDQRFGKLIAKEYIGTIIHKGGRTAEWRCVCDCGTTVRRSTDTLQKAIKNNWESVCAHNCEKRTIIINGTYGLRQEAVLE